MEKVVNSDGSTEWKTFLDVRKSFVSLVFSPISPIFADFHAGNVKKYEKVKKVNKVKK